MALRYYESGLHISAENVTLLEEILALPIEEAELRVEDELDQDGGTDMRA